MEGKRDFFKVEKELKCEEESKNSKPAQESSQSEVERLRAIEKAQIEKITKLRGQLANQEVTIDKLRRDNEKIKEKVKSVVISTREAELEMALRLSQMDSGAKKGLSEAEIDNLPMFTLDYSTECTVCKELIPPEHIVKSLPFCGHISHQPCIDTWLMSNKSCPECLTPVSEV